jgi:hypothetical protein
MQSYPQAGHGCQLQTSTRIAERFCTCDLTCAFNPFQGLLVQQQLASGGHIPSTEVSNGRHPKLSSIQSTDTVSLQTLSDPSEEAGGTLPASVSMQSRPGSKVGNRLLPAGQSGLAHF